MNETAGSDSFEKRRKIQWLIIMVMVMPAICLYSGSASAETIWTPSILVTATRDDNILFSRTDPVDDYIYAAKPELRFDYNREITHITAAGSALVRRYQDNTDLNDENYRFDLKGDTNVSERFRLRGDYEFIKDTTLDSELQEIGRVFTREDRSSHNVRLAPTFNLSERSSIGLDGRYRNVAYDSEAFVDYTVWEVNLPVSWRLETQVDRLYVSPGYSDRDSDVNHSKSYNLRFGWNHETTERLNMNLAVGARYTELEQKDTGETDENWSGLGNLLLNYKFETGRLRLDFLHDLRTTADGNQVNVSRALVSLRWHFSERTGMDLNGGYYYTTDEGRDNSDSYEYWKAGTELFYNLTEHHDIFIAYQYSQNYQENIPDDPRAERNAVWAGIKLSFPMQ